MNFRFKTPLLVGFFIVSLMIASTLLQMEGMRTSIVAAAAMHIESGKHSN